jgi:predicted NACHT family NTPase
METTKEYNADVDKYNEVVEEENEQFISIDKGALFKLIRLFKEVRQTYDESNSQGVYERNRYKVLANFCEALLEHGDVDGLIKNLENRIATKMNREKIVNAIKEHGVSNDV